MTRCVLPALILPLAFLACERPPPSTSGETERQPDEKVAAAVAVVAPEPAPTPPPVSVSTIVRSVAAVEPAGASPLSPSDEIVVDPGARFEIELSVAAPDARLALIDASDAHVAAEAALEIGSTTRLSLTPASPLVPGSRYVLRLDGAVSRELHDTAGRAYAPAGFPILAAGTPPPPPAQKPARARRQPKGR
jgi:hypothetical protein